MCSGPASPRASACGRPPPSSFPTSWCCPWPCLSPKRYRWPQTRQELGDDFFEICRNDPHFHSGGVESGKARKICDLQHCVEMRANQMAWKNRGCGNGRVWPDTPLIQNGDVDIFHQIAVKSHRTRQVPSRCLHCRRWAVGVVPPLPSSFQNHA